MFHLRSGSLLDLIILAAGENMVTAADRFSIPYSTLAAYIAGTRYPRQSAVPSLATAWARFWLEIVSDEAGETGETEDDEEKLPPEVMHAFDFEEMFRLEQELRSLIGQECWLHSFSCCAAQVLARFEAAHPGQLSFTQADALQLLDWIAVGDLLEQDKDRFPLKFAELALRYVLWRVKTREYYFLEQFYPRLRAIEARGNQPIPVIPDDLAMSFDPDHRRYADSNLQMYGIHYPDVPRLKLGATLDTLLLCRSVAIKVDYAANFPPCYICSCVSPFGDEIRFRANPSAPPRPKR